MSGTPLTDLKTAAKTFVDYFAATQNEDKLGLITFATSVRVDRAIGTNFVTPMKTAITAMTADNYTNAEDAIAQADGPSGFTNTAGVQEFLIFFSDGQPTCFRGTSSRAASLTTPSSDRARTVREPVPTPIGICTIRPART